MRVLLDEQLPRQLSGHLEEHEVRTVQQQRWAGTKNGELLRLAVEAGFESFLTADHNLEYQQNLQALVSALAAEWPNARRHPSVARLTGGKSFDKPSRVAMIESHA